MVTAGDHEGHVRVDAATPAGVGGFEVRVAGAPPIPGLRFRTCRGPVDAPALVAVQNAELADDGILELYTAEELAAELAHPGIEVPERDLIIAEVDGVPVAYARRAWTDRGAVRVYEHTGRVHPAWRRRGLGRALLRHQAAVLRTLAVEQAHAGEVALGSWTDEPNLAATALLVAEGYRPIRWYVEMVRPSIDPVAAASIPDGIRIATPDPADRGLLLALLAIEEEAFRDQSTVAFYYPDESDRVRYPIPPAPRIEAGSDRHILMLDRSACRLYELYDADRASGRWTAGSGATWSLRSNALRPAGWTSADAAGLPILPGLARYEEVAAGEIAHALRFTAPRTRTAFVYPARHQAGESDDPALPPMGLRVRLKASVDISRFGPQSQVVLRALQRYGMMLADNGAPWYAGGAPDARWDDDDLHRLGELTGADFEVVDTTTLTRAP